MKHVFLLFFISLFLASCGAPRADYAETNPGYTKSTRKPAEIELIMLEDGPPKREFKSIGTIVTNTHSTTLSDSTTAAEAAAVMRQKVAEIGGDAIINVHFVAPGFSGGVGNGSGTVIVYTKP